MRNPSRLVALLSAGFALCPLTLLPAGEIHDAATAGDLDKVKTLLEADPQPLESEDGDESTPLINACVPPPSFNRQVALANVLMDKGANIHARNTSGGSPVHVALRNLDLMPRLIAMGADVNVNVNVRPYSELPALHQSAAFTEEFRVAKLLIDHGAAVNARSSDGTIVHWAIADAPPRTEAHLGQPPPSATPHVTAAGVPESDYRIKWSRIADYPVRLSELAAIGVQGRLHVIGGKITKDNQDLADNCDVDFNYAYDPASDKWTRRTGMPTARYDVGLAERAGRVFAISSHNESYEPTSDAWHQHPPLEHGGAHLGVAAGENEIFVFGFEGPNRCSQSWAFNPNTNAWRERAPIPTPRMFPVVTALGGRIFVMGGLGYDGKGHLGPVRNAVEVYDPATDRWETKRPMPDAVFGAVGAGVFDGRIFLVGVTKGESLADTRLAAEVYTYAPETDAWSRVPDSMPHNQGGAGVAVLDGRVYVIGGHDDAFEQFSHAYVGEIEVAGTESTTSGVSNERLPVVSFDQGVAHSSQVLKTLAAEDRP